MGMTRGKTLGYVVLLAEGGEGLFEGCWAQVNHAGALLLMENENPINHCEPGRIVAALAPSQWLALKLRTEAA